MTDVGVGVHQCVELSPAVDAWPSAVTGRPSTAVGSGVSATPGTSAAARRDGRRHVGGAPFWPTIVATAEHVSSLSPGPAAMQRGEHGLRISGGAGQGRIVLGGIVRALWKLLICETYQFTMKALCWTVGPLPGPDHLHRRLPLLPADLLARICWNSI